MAPQTTYSRNQSASVPAGTLADGSFSRIGSWMNGTGADCPAGIGAIAKASNEGQFDLPADATKPLCGIILNSYGRDPGYSGSALAGSNAIRSAAVAPLMEEGATYVVFEQTMTPDDPVFVRFATSVNTPSLAQKGSFRKDPDGVAQVTTLTPTATNSLVYVLRVEVPDPTTNRLRAFTFEYQADGSATATEIVTGFKTAMAADASFTALIVATGTTTLILTSQNAGYAFTAQGEGDGALATAATTPPAPTARRCKGARVVKGGNTTGTSGIIYFSAAVEASHF